MKYHFKYIPSSKGFITVRVNRGHIATIKTTNHPETDKHPIASPIMHGKTRWDLAVELTEAKDHGDINGLNLGMKRATAEWLIPNERNERVPNGIFQLE